MDSAKFRQLSVILIVGLFLSLLVPGAIAQTATPPQPTPVGEFEIIGNLESINSGFIVVSGQTISIIGAEINDPLMLHTRVKVHASFVNGQFIAREVEYDDDDDNGNLNGNANSNSNTNQNGNANSNTNGNDNVNVTPAVTPMVTLQQAIASVLEVYPTTSIRSVELKTRFGGTLVWEIEIANRTELTIDAASGAILTIEQRGDDDNDNGNGNNNDNNDDGDVNGNGNFNGNGNSNDNQNDNGQNNNVNGNDNNDDHGGDDDNGGHGSDDDHDDDNSGHGSDDDHDDDNSGRGSDDDDD